MAVAGSPAGSPDVAAVVLVGREREAKGANARTASPVPPLKRLIVAVNAVAEETPLDRIDSIFDFRKLFVKPHRPRSRCGGHADINKPDLFAELQHCGRGVRRK